VNATALLVLAGAWVFGVFGTDTVVVPKVVGSSETVARAELGRLGFPVDVHRQANRKVRSGVVVLQRPVPGTAASTKGPVYIVVSSGVPTVTVSSASVAGRPYSEVKADLEKRGLTVSQERVPGPGTPGTVAGVAPEGKVPVGGHVTVTVIEG
jgi:serine/threonine-protein kinase